MFLHRVGEGAEDHALFGERRAERGANRDTVKHRIDGDAGETVAFVQRDAELLVRFKQLGIDVGQALWSVALFLGCRIINDVLVIDRRIMDVRPGRFLKRQPMAESFETPFQQPFRLLLLEGNEADNVLVQSWRGGFVLDVGDKSVFVLLFDKTLDGFGRCAH